MVFLGLEGDLEAVVAAPSIANVAIIFVQSKDVSLQMISDELKAWGLEGWD